jgi:hypothetical protein
MTGKDERAQKRKKLLELIDVLLDTTDTLPDDELDQLYRQVKPDENPKDWIRTAAFTAARSHRIGGEKVPYHVQAALEATKPTVEDSSPSGLMKRVDSLLSPAIPSPRLSASADSFPNTPDQELSERDRAILQRLAEEISNSRNG